MGHPGQADLHDHIFFLFSPLNYPLSSKTRSEASPLNTTSMRFGAGSLLFKFRFSLRFVNSTQFSIKANRAIDTDTTEADSSHGALESWFYTTNSPFLRAVETLERPVTPKVP